MAYDYAREKPALFTEQGQVDFLTIRDGAKELIRKAGAVRADKVMFGDSWFCMAALDRLVELHELREITGDNVMGQHRVFVTGSKP